MSNFDELYAGLNARQKQAVDAIDGPVMVIAGPGTGKTQILAARIMNIRQQTDTAPENILCLTFTDAGSTAMQKRLMKFMGNDAYRVNIHTFHSLCNRIISEYPEHFSKRDLRVMDDLERIEIVQKIIADLPASSPIKDYSSNNFSTHKTLLNLWKIMDDVNIDAHQIAQNVEALKDHARYLEAFPDHAYKKNMPKENAVKGDVNKKKYADNHGFWTKLIEAAQLLEVYKKHKADAGVYEFNDMIDWVYQKFKNDPDFKQLIQERYHYVLVDEFQDTSGKQADILYYLIDYYEENPNCFVVGDDDQSIYAFQGARVQNMIEFKNRFQEHLQVVMLKDNYRSASPILEASTQLIKFNQDRLVNTDNSLIKDLECSGDNRNYPLLPFQATAYFNEFHQSIGISNEIEALIQSGVEPNEIAILYSKHASSKALIDLFQIKKIPFVLSKNANILTEPIIVLLLKWLNFIDRESKEANSADHLIYELLVSPIYRITPIEINQLSTEIDAWKRNKYKDESLSVGWRNYLNALLTGEITAEYLSENSITQLKLLWKHAEIWIQNCQQENVGVLISKVYSEGGFVSFATQNEQSRWNLEVLHTFLDYAMKQSDRFPYITLSELLAQIESLKNAQLEIPLAKRLGQENGVQMMSAHGSKGLEFDYVFVVSCTENEWLPSSNNRYPYRINHLLLAFNKTIPSQNSADQEIEERRRLFFVAITRGKRQVRLSYFLNEYGKKTETMTPSQFVAESVKDFTENTPNTVNFSDEDLNWAHLNILMRSAKPSLEEENMDWINHKLETFTFSPSSIKNILKCGLSFFYSNIVRIPSAPNENTAYGNAVHGTMRILIEQFVSEGLWPSEKELISVFHSQMHKFKGNFTEKQFKARTQQGEHLIPLILANKKDVYLKNRIFKTEYSLQSTIGNVPVKGSIDKIAIDGNSVQIFDYKTGSNSRMKTDSNLGSRYSEDKLPPNYWFQVGIYGLLIKNKPDLNWEFVSGGIESMNPEDDNTLPVWNNYYTKEHFELIEKWVIEADRKLKNKEFLTGCGDEKCYWCNFSKENDLVKHLPEVED